MRLLKWSAGVAVVSGLLIFPFLLVQHRLQVVHPVWWAYFLLVLLNVGGWILTGALAVRQFFRRERRAHASVLFAAAILPSVLLSLLAWYAWTCFDARRFTLNPLTRMAAVAGESLMMVEAVWGYPNRIETERLVMFYDELKDPQGDAAKGDAYVAKLEELVGRPLRAKIYWIRGELIGQGGLAYGGLCLGSEKSWHRHWAGKMDRHELTHSVMWQIVKPDSRPPALLSEGWAERQSIADPKHLARRALDTKRKAKSKDLEPDGILQQLVGPRWYCWSYRPVYYVGGALADFLIRRYGIERFLELLIECRPSTFHDDCWRILGDDWVEIEELFWRDAEALVADAPR
ncbi:MAG: hypothetical protein ACYTAF_15795 [Planctomycetota bacterium]|jgi:hypothetical protein